MSSVIYRFVLNFATFVRKAPLWRTEHNFCISGVQYVFSYKNFLAVSVARWPSIVRMSLKTIAYYSFCFSLSYVGTDFAQALLCLVNKSDCFYVYRIAFF